MKIYFSAFLCILFVGCSVQKTNQPSSQPVQESYETRMMNRKLNYSSTFFLLAEAAVQEQLYEDAIKLYIYADRENPDNIFVKETLLELLDFLANFDESYFQEIINFSDSFIDKGVYNAKILLIVSRAYGHFKNVEKAHFLIKEALKLEPNMRNYYIYFAFKKEQFAETDYSLLKQALTYEWKEFTILQRIAIAFEETEPETTLDILEKSFQKWQNEETLVPLVEQYEKFEKSNEIIELLSSFIDETQEVNPNLKSYFIVQLFRQQRLEELIERKGICFEIGTENLLKLLFISAMQLRNYELAIQAGKAIISAPDFDTSTQSSFFAHLAEAYFLTNDEQNLLAFTSKITDIGDLMKLYTLIHTKNEDNSQEKLYAFMEKSIEQSLHAELFHAAAGLIYSLDDEKEKVIEHFSHVSNEFIVEQEMENLFIAANIQISEDTKKAKELLQLVDKETPADELIFYALFSLENKELAIKLTLRELEEQAVPTSNSFQIVSELFSKQNELELLFFWLKKAVELYPEDAALLNLYGYSIALYDKEEYYSLAEEALLKALSLEPQNMAITDSLAWLYYKQGKYEKAKEVMEPFSIEKIVFSEIAYHLGKIHWKLKQNKEAIIYFQKAISLDDDEKYVELSQQKLLEIEE